MILQPIVFVLGLNSATATTLRSRVPSKSEALRVFLACVFLINAWAIVVVLNEVPAWWLQLDTWDVIGAISYPLVVALIESIVVLGVVIGLAAVVPHSWLRSNFVATTTGIVYLAAAWAALAHFNDQVVQAMSIRQLAPWAGVFVVSQVAVVWAIHRSRRLESLIEATVERLIVLAALYVLVDIAAVAVVLLRNLGAA